MSALLAAQLPALPVLLPLAAGIVLLALRGAPLSLQRALSLAAVVALLVVDVALWQQVQPAPSVYRLGDWAPPVGIVLVADPLAAWMLIVTALVAVLALLAAVRGEDAEGPNFHVLWQWQLCGLNGAFLTGDLFNLFVFFEVLLLASYGLLLHGGGRLRTRAGLHYVVLNLVGSTLFLFAAGVIYGLAGSLNLADLTLRLHAAPASDVPLLQGAVLLLAVVFALKAAVLPLSLWLPQAYAQTGAAVAALFAIMTKVGLYAILRVDVMLLGPALFGAGLQPLLVVAALATLAAGALGLLGSASLRQMAAFATILSVGTLLLGLALGTAGTISAALYYLPHSVFTGAALFLLAGLVAAARGQAGDRLDVAAAMARRGWLAGLFFVLAMASIGLPPLAGFWAKVMLLQAAQSTPYAAWAWAVLLLAGLAALLVYARAGTRVFMREAPDAVPGLAPRAADLAPVAGLIALGVALVVFAAPISAAAERIAQQVLQPAGYVQAVMGDAGVGSAAAGAAEGGR